MDAQAAVGPRRSSSGNLVVEYSYRRPPSSVQTRMVEAGRLEFHECFVVIYIRGGSRLVFVAGIVGTALDGKVAGLSHVTSCGIVCVSSTTPAAWSLFKSSPSLLKIVAMVLPGDTGSSTG